MLSPICVTATPSMDAGTSTVNRSPSSGASPMYPQIASVPSEISVYRKSPLVWTAGSSADITSVGISSGEISSAHAEIGHVDTIVEIESSTSFDN